MKKISLFFLIIFLLTNCRKNHEETDWKTIDFKYNYTIQVPVGFTGGVQPGFEGNSFYAASADKKIQLYSGYGYALGVNDFGDALQNPVPQNIQVTDYTNSKLITLDKIENFYQGSQIIGILFYFNDNNSWGRLYWKDDNVFKDALEIDFNLTDLETVNKIIQSIKRK